MLRDKKLGFDTMCSTTKLGINMYKIVLDRECGCFKRSDMTNNIEVASKDEALEKSLEMVNTMNNDFCSKHKFSLEEVGDTFLIKMS